MSVWFLLRQYGKRVSAARIIRACRHTKRNGCYTITLALALHEFGLPVSFHTDPDPAIEPQEARCYERAQRCGMPVKPAVSLSMLLRLTRLRPAIVYYAGSDGGHFSPLVGFRRGLALLPYNEGDDLPEGEFGERWSSPGYPRQCVLVGV